ncbi:MAG TPA: DNRLRE domain-containing protein [Polyangiaceae bacterium]
MRTTKNTVVFALTAALAGSTLGCSGAGAEEVRAETATAALVDRPAARLLLTPAMLARLKARAASGDAAWTELKRRCDDYTTGTFHPPNGTAYATYPNVGQGYQGEEYPPVVRALGLCYRTTSDAGEQSRYGAAGARLLDAMSTPVGSGGQSPSTDSGYGIRNYVVGMALGFDWLYPALSSATKTRVVSSMNTWIDWYDQSGFIKDDPIGNYFAGYFLAKTAASLATEGENAKAATYWDDVVSRMWGTLVKPQFTQHMAGGGWPEGWGYGRKAVLSMAEVLWSVKTAKNLDWWQEVPLARDQTRYVAHFAWPSLQHMDDQGTIRAGANLRPSAELMNGLASLLEATGDASAATARGVSADIAAAAGDDSAPWSKFLYGEPAAAKAASSTNGLSHFARGPGHVAVRSSWARDAAWGALAGGAYINADYSGEQLFNAGGVSVVVGDQPLLINPTGFLPQNGGTAGEDLVYEDSYGTRQRRLYNTFFVNDASNPFNPGQNSFDPSKSSAHIERFEDRGTFVHARAVGLEDQYGSSSAHPVSQFTRDLVFVRPGTFVLFDRTTVASAGADQWLSFHTPVAPRSVAAADATQRHFDVAAGSTLVGSIRTLLPKNASTSTVSLPASAARLEVHAPVRAASQDWLTLVTASSTPGNAVRLSPEDGNVTSGDVLGVELGAPHHHVVLFARDHAAIAAVTNVAYTVGKTAGEHVLVDVAPSSTGYGVTATASGDDWHVVVSPGGPLEVSANKTLSFTLSATGGVSAGTGTAPDPTTPDSDPKTPDAEDPTTPDPPTTDPTDPSTPPDARTVTFTSGVDGYAGTVDASIASLDYSSSKNPEGTVYKVDGMLYTYTLAYAAKALLRFDVSSIPANAVIRSASLSVTAESWVNSQSLIGNFLATPWDLTGASFGWTSGGAGSAWSVPGIGSGDVAGPRFLLTGIDASGYQRKTAELDPASVERWVREPSTNHGVLLTNPNSNRVLRLFSSEAKNAAQRPTLSVTYTE